MALTIPQIRARLHELSHEPLMPFAFAIELRELAEATRRRPPARRRAPPQRQTLTPKQREQIRAFARNYPHADFMTIASYFNTNTGRVSEAISGKRGG